MKIDNTIKSKSRTKREYKLSIKIKGDPKKLPDGGLGCGVIATQIAVIGNKKRPYSDYEPWQITMGLDQIGEEMIKENIIIDIEKL